MADHPFVHVGRSDLAGYLCACTTSRDTQSPVECDLMFRAEQSKQRSYKVSKICYGVWDQFGCIPITLEML